MNFQRYLSQRSCCRTPSPIRALFPLSQVPGMLNLAGGLPHPATFPIVDLSIKLRDGTTIELPRRELEAALQYCPSYGLPALLEQVTSFMQTRHAPPRKGWNICVGTGSQDVLGKAFDMLLDHGDSVILEEASYPGVLSALQVYQPTYLTVSSDEQGMIPESLDRTVAEAQSNALKKGLRRPYVVYLCPTGQNPTGSTMSNARKREIYSICQQRDLILLEDDPYYHLHFGDDQPRESFLSLDLDGRVLRFDSLSKVLSAGMRIGWVTGAQEFVERIQLDMQTQALNVSGISQVLAANIFRQLGPQGFDRHVREVCSLYRQRRDTLVQACRTHLDGLVDFHVPEAGMFIWLKLKTVEDSEALVMVRAQDEKVLFVPGSAFTPRKDVPSPFVRASYSTVSAENMDEAMLRLRRLLV